MFDRLASVHDTDECVFGLITEGKSRKMWGGGEGVIDHRPYEETAMCSLSVSVSVFGGWLMVRRAGAIRRIAPPRVRLLPA